MANLSQVKLGDALPDLDVPLTAAIIVGGAIASRDYTPVHHDRAAVRDAAESKQQGEYERGTSHFGLRRPSTDAVHTVPRPRLRATEAPSDLDSVARDVVVARMEGRQQPVARDASERPDGGAVGLLAVSVKPGRE